MAFGWSTNRLIRQGKDLVDNFNLSFQQPNKIGKSIYAVSNKLSFLNDNIGISAFGKLYQYNGEIIVRDPNQEIVSSNPSFSNVGFGIANRFLLIDGLEIKASYEKAYRMPEPHEILGDGIYISVNPTLQPEISHNLNTNVTYQSAIDQISFTLNTNYFYRNSQHFIRFLPQGPFGQFENLENVTSSGVEGGLAIDYKEKIQLSTNITYQEFGIKINLMKACLTITTKVVYLIFPTFLLMHA